MLRLGMIFARREPTGAATPVDLMPPYTVCFLSNYRSRLFHLNPPPRKPNSFFRELGFLAYVDFFVVLSLRTTRKKLNS